MAERDNGVKSIPFEMEPPDKNISKMRAHVITTQAFAEGNYEIEDRFDGAGQDDPLTVRTTEGLIKLAESGKAEIDARVICVGKDGVRAVQKMDTKRFVESWKKEENNANLKFKEAGRMRPMKSNAELKEYDSFAYDGGNSWGNEVGQDYVPLLGGPFNKQLYIYDYLKMHATAFHAYHHDPIARRIVNLQRDFTLGRGFQVVSKNPMAQALWNAFEEVNDLYNLMDYVAKEIEIYGETMLWFLPNNQTKIGFQLSGNQRIPVGVIPRVRIIDPSVIWEIVTYPEDITRVLYYQWVAQTQYQIYQGQDQGGRVPSSKFIYQQIPGDQVDHWKVNCVSNEKRGRSGLFPVLGYLKRLRDTVNYSIINLQKNAAWSLDTEIDGSQADIDAYAESQKSLGTIPAAGSEFIHSTKVKRSYLGSQHSAGSQNLSFDWCLSMIATGVGIPISYLNTHLASGATKASALVGTEPVTKMFEKRQLLYEQILLKFAKRLFEQFGLEDAHIEVTFPELVTQDRSAKLADLALAQSLGWVSKKRAAEIAAQELQITEFNFDREQDEIEDEESMTPQKTNPLTTPPAVDNHDATTSRSSIDASGRSNTAINGTQL